MTQYLFALSHEGIQHPDPTTYFIFCSDLALEDLRRKTIAEILPTDQNQCKVCRATLTKIDGIEAVKLMERRHRSPH
ncbi:hypothetical protein KBC75_03335 [Candidatus Shapirobacteria bacterium]|nr:hypothetical protein [Candidatus Shapirobacteria bacterium]